MPVIQVQYPAGSLEAGHKATLGARLTDVLLTMEGGARTPGGFAFASVLFSELPAGDWYIGGRTDGSYVHPPGKYLVRVTIPEGYMSQVHKTEVHAKVNQAFLDTLGGRDSPAAGGSILVIIEEVTEGDWGCAGKTISLASIADTVGLPKSGERFAWVRAYFAAKARQFAAARYPADVGGLFPRSETEGSPS